MTDIFSPLAGETQAPEQTPVPETATADSDVGALGGVPAPPPFGQTVAKAANNLAEQQSPQQAARPGGWARTLVGGVMDALSGFVAGGAVGPQHAEEAQKLMAAKAQKQQQAIENQQKQQQMSREEAIARATIAHENASTAHEQMLTSMLGQEYRTKNIETGTASIQPYIKAGAPIIQEGVDSDELRTLVQQKKLNPTQQHAFATGQKEVLDASGKPEVDEMGNPVTRPTYTVVGDVPQVELDDASSKLISENTPYKLPPHSKMSGLVYGTLTAQATAAQTATAAIDEARKEQNLKSLETDEKLAQMKVLPDWGTALAKSKNDPFAALRYMENDPAMKQKYPDAANQIQALYGGPKEWETMRHDRADEALKAQELADKKLTEKNNFQGNPDAATPQAFLESLNPDEKALIDLIHSGRAPVTNMGYLLARKPEIVEAMERAYPGEFDASKVGAYQSTYKDFASGKDADQLQAGAVALQHLEQLKQLNTLKSRIPGTADQKAYDNLADTVSSELGRFYDNNTIPGIAGYKKTLAGIFNRNAAIDEQVHAMGVRMDSYDTKWSSAAPSKAYEAQMPGQYAAARQARANVDPEYRDKITPTAPTPQAPKTPAPPPGSVPVQIPGMAPGWVPANQLDAFKKAHPNATVTQ